MPARELKALHAAAEHYIEFRTTLEIDQSSLIRARLVVEQSEYLRDQLLEAIEQLHDPAFIPKAFALSVHAEMAGQLKQIASCPWLAPGHGLVPGVVTRVGIQRTQLAWKAYRDAFVVLALAVRRTATASDWQAWLGEVRVAQLRDLAAAC